jgi:hypothetical protein
MRTSRRLGMLAAAATLATATAGTPATALAYFDTAHGRVPVYVPQPVVSEPTPHSTDEWPLVAAGGAAAIALAGAVALRTNRTRARAGA